MDSRKDILVAVIVAAVGLFIFVVGYNIPPPLIKDTIGPRAFPLGIGLFLLLGGLVQALRSTRAMNAAGNFRVEAEGAEDDDRFPASGYRALALIALAFGLALSLHALGYLIVMPIFIAGGLLALNERNPLFVGGSAVLYTAATFALFSTLLGVRLPLGPLAVLFAP